MITFFRRWANSVPALILLGLILVAFAVTGVGDPFGGPVATGTTLAKLGDRTLTEADLQTAFDRSVQSARAQNPNINQVELAKQGAVATIADQLIGTTAIEEVARQAGLSASDRAVGAEIAAIPAFQTAGKFDETGMSCRGARRVRTAGPVLAGQAGHGFGEVGLDLAGREPVERQGPARRHHQ